MQRNLCGDYHMSDSIDSIDSIDSTGSTGSPELKTITEALEEKIPFGDSCSDCPSMNIDFFCDLMEEPNLFLQKQCGINEEIIR